MGWRTGIGLLSVWLAMPSLAGDVVATGAWVRETVAGQTASAAYVGLNSRGGGALVGVSSPLAQSASLHEMVLDNGVMKMRPMERLELPAGRPVALRPGSYHIMLLGLKRVLHPGESVPLALRFRDRAGHEETMDVVAAVRDLSGQTASGSAQQPHSHSHHMH